MSELRSSICFPRSLIVVYGGLSVVDGAIAVLAFWQLMRIHSRTLQRDWTRQKVLHLMIGFSNLGYLVDFVSTLIATCKGWECWASSCGFIFMGIPKILFLAAFLLMLSFWIDLCHQEDDEDDEALSSRESLLENRSDGSAAGSHQKCFPIPLRRVGSRQKIVILVTTIVFILLILFAVLIWIGMGKNPINSSTVSRKVGVSCSFRSLVIIFCISRDRVYVDIFAVFTLLLGGALACYGVLIYLKMSKVRSERSSTEMRKVIGLASISLTCFITSSLVALLTDVPLLYRWRHQYNIGFSTALLVLVYYFIGSSVPSAFVLWIMRELPPSATSFKEEEPTIVTFVDRSTRVNNPQGWTYITSSQNQVSRASPI